MQADAGHGLQMSNSCCQAAPQASNARGALAGLEKRKTELLPSGPKSSFLMRASFASHLATKVPESGGRPERREIEDA